MNWIKMPKGDPQLGVLPYDGKTYLFCDERTIVYGRFETTQVSGTYLVDHRSNRHVHSWPTHYMVIEMPQD